MSGIQRRLRLGTRASALALWQAHHVRDSLRAHWGEDLVVELVEITTEGDRILDRPLNEVGGKGLFVKGIEELLLRDEIDLAVHSMKDLPGHLPEGLTITCTPERADPRDVLVGPEGVRLATLPPGTRVGSSSLRRGALTRRINPGVEIVSIRGNVATRIGKIAAGVVDVVLLAAAGLDRLGHAELIRERLAVDEFCPAACQGILAIEIRESDRELADLLAPLNHASTQIVAAAERSFLARLEGGCQVPMACHATLAGDRVHVRGLVVDPSGEPIYDASTSGAAERATEIGRELAETLLERGAGDVFERLARR
ncbi:hydroxymethylbilane synthase [Nannocystaceae bacterium ST9]